MIQNVFSLNPQIIIEESSTYIEQESMNYEVHTLGKVTIYNPSNISHIYQISFPIDYFNNLDIILKDDSSFFMSQYQIYSNEFLLGDSISFEYKITGLMSKYEYNYVKSNSISNLEFKTTSLDLKPLRGAELNKLERENPFITNISKRDIIIEIINPTEFEVNLTYVRLFKTSSNASAIINSSITLSETVDVDLVSNQRYISNEVDFYSDDKSICWIDYQVSTINIITRNLKFETISKPILDDDEVIIYNDTYDNIDSEINNSELNIIFEKSASRVSIGLNESVEITLKVRNLNEDIENILLTDFLPFQFISSSNLSFNIFKFKNGDTISFEYLANLMLPFNSETIYLEPAVLKYDDMVLYSNSVNLFYNDENEIRKLIVEKELISQENGTKVIIRIKNVGTIDLRDIVVIETNKDEILIDSGSENVKYIWNITELPVDEEWEVSYEMSNEISDISLPEVYAPGNVLIYKTLILNEMIVSDYENSVSPAITIVVATAILLFFVDMIL